MEGIGMKRVLSFFICIVMLTGLYSAAVSCDTPANMLKIGVAEEPDSLSPLITYERSSFEIFMLIYDSLITFDENMQPVPSLAESWEVNQDSLQWTFKLRRDVKWSDGESFTSKDVKFTFELMKNSGLGLYTDLVKDIDVIETPDDYTVVFKTEKPKANMLQNITPILPEHIWKTIEEDQYEVFDNQNPIGTGAFILKEWKKNEYISFVSNKEYFKGAPKVDGLIYIIYANRDTMAQSIKLGEIDAALGLYKSNTKTIENDKSITAFNFSENGFTELAFNCRADGTSKGNPLILDKRIRQAIEYSIDKQKIIDMVYDGEGEYGTTLIPVSQKKFHYNPDATEFRGYSPDKAKKLLESADYKDRDGDGIREDAKGKKLSFRLLLRSENTMEVKAGQMIKGYLKDAGIETELETLDDGALNDRIFSSADYDMFIWGWGGDVDPGTLLRVLTTNQIDNLNDAFYSNPEYDRLVEEQASNMNFEERVTMLYDAQRILYEDLPYMILFYEKERQLIRNDRIQGIRPTVNGAVFYADTPYNYLQASIIGAEDAAKTEEKEGKGGEPNLIVYFSVAVVVVFIAITLIKKKKKSKEEW